MHRSIRHFVQAAIFSTLVTTAMAAIAADGTPVVGTRTADGSGYPSLVRLTHQDDQAKNGRLLMAFEQDGLAGIPLWASDDDGAHWHFQQNVVDQAHPGDHLWQLRWQPNLTEMSRASGPLKPGTLLLAANATGNTEQGRLIAEDLQLYASTDQGHHWDYRGSIIKGGGNPSDKDNKGVWEPNIHILDDGRMVAYYSSEQHKAEGYNQLLAHKLSSDGGRSWGKEKVDVAIPGG
ncbi:MAG: sialidase family protein, partial [Rhodanobacter sp.]